MITGFGNVRGFGDELVRLVPRRKKSAKERRDQHVRSMMRSVQHMLGGLDQLATHHGSQLNLVSACLVQAVRQVEADSMAQDTSRQAPQAPSVPDQGIHSGIPGPPLQRVSA